MSSQVKTTDATQPPRTHVKGSPPSPFADWPYVFTWSYEFKHAVRDVWELVSNTDRMNKAAGLSPVAYRDVPQEGGGSQRFGDTKVLGLRLRWREHPYEWVLHHYFRNERTYTSGPLKRFADHWQFTATPTGCRVDQTVAVVPSNWLMGLVAKVQIGISLRGAYLRAYSHIEDYLDNRAACPFKPTRADRFTPAAGFRAQLIARLVRLDVAEALATHAVDYVIKSPPEDLVRMRPMRLAKLWQTDRNAVLSMLLRGTKAGLFNLSWDLLCPSCRGAKDRHLNLADIESAAHCDACSISYGLDFDKSVEITFSPHPTVRPVEVAEYCVGGPQNTPHFLTQLRIMPGQERQGVMHVDEGVFVLRSLQSKTRYRLNVTRAAPPSERLALAFHANAADEVLLTMPPGACAFSLKNCTRDEIVAIFERATWLEDVCTAAYVTSQQEFRDLFPSDLLRPGENLSVGAMALLFTDLKGSTAIYERIGDAQAFALVREHFAILIDAVVKDQGCVVKTIGDAVMAAFTQPTLALRAALQIQQRIGAYNKKMIGSEALTLKIGLHFGPCLAVNLNDRLDYFGSAVNMAARIEGQCEGGDVVISEMMFEQPGVAALIAEAKLQPEHFRRTLRGLAREVGLVRLRT